MKVIEVEFRRVGVGRCLQTVVVLEGVLGRKTGDGGGPKIPKGIVKATKLARDN